MDTPVATMLMRWIPPTFDVQGRVTVSLLRSYTNDVYLVESARERFALKVYGVDWRDDTELRYEAALLSHLAERGIPVALPMPGSNGDVLQVPEIGGKRRQAMLFAYVDGENPVPPFTTGDYRRMGKATAALHAASDDFATEHRRRSLDLDYLLGEPLKAIAAMSPAPSNLRDLHDLAGALHEQITELSRTGLDWGPCHGDVTFDNVHHTDDGRIIWYDFDSGGPGWRAIDLQGWAGTLPEHQRNWQAFLDGYRTIRGLADAEVRAAPFLWLAQEIWGVSVNLRYRVALRGPEVVHEWLADEQKRLGSLARRLGLT